jgi:transcriptional regulator with XRE-family HTH domain
VLKPIRRVNVLKKWDQKQGNHLRELLKQYRPGKSIRAIASEAGVNHSNLSRVLRGDLAPSENMLKSLASIGIPVPIENNTQNELTAADMALLNFDGESCPAWQFTIDTIMQNYDGDHNNSKKSNLSDNTNSSTAVNTGCSYTKLVESISVFFILGKLVSPAIITGFMLSLMNFNKEQLHHWLTDQAGKDPMARRLLFHATLFAIDPLAYTIEGGLLQIDQAVHFEKPDICINTPLFGVRFVREYQKELE